MVARVLRDQKPDGGWNIKEPDWDVHACFDAVFILRQLGGNEPKVKQAIARGADWSLSCRNLDGLLACSASLPPTARVSGPVWANIA